jgi:NAD(P)-dependent dehydrogenase (short-subunit alcohol dehydrogenase family)
MLIENNLSVHFLAAHLSLHYLKVNKKTGDLKSLILIGSMGMKAIFASDSASLLRTAQNSASWIPIPGGTLYSASKHAILGLMRSLYLPLQLEGIRIGVIHPFFAGM